MGTISISLPIKTNGSFRIKDPKQAKRLLKDIEQHAERISPFDDVLGIWSGRKENEKALTERLRAQNNLRND